ncbi:hypothetical protein HY78_00520 [Rhizorhabdus wittichii DC-6]|nr:hypothetical protein HY78_00520 [Rhizorhabdus wittichii DC-6]
MLFGGSEAESKVNIKTGANATLIGAPTYGDGYADVGGTVGFDSGIVSSSNAWTHCVVTTIGSGNGLYMGCQNSGDADNAIGRFNTSVYPFIAGSTRGGGTPYASATGFNFLAASHNGATAKIHAASAGAITTVSAAWGASAVTASLRVGGHIGSGTTANRVAAAMSFNRVLSDAEVLTVHDYLKFLCEQRGVAVV